MSILFSQSSSSLALSLKILFISTSVLSAAMLLKISAPAIADFAVTDVPSFYNVVVSWLRPPYLYLVINCIIITIVASSKLQSKAGTTDVSLSPSPSVSPLVTSPPPPVAVHPQQPMLIFPDPVKHYDYDDVAVNRDAVEAVKLHEPEVFEYIGNNFVSNGLNHYKSKVSEANNEDFVIMNATAKLEPEVFNYTANTFVSKGINNYETKVFEADKSFVSKNATVASRELEMSNYSDEVLVAKSTQSPSPSPSPISRRDSSDFSFSNEKPPVSKRIGQRRAVKASPEGGKAVLGVTKTKKQDTLESTWKTITEGRAMPLTRHLRKSDTWETHGGRRHQNPQTPENQKMTKSETFKDRTNTPLLTPSPGSGKLKKEPSLGQDELNKRVEAFIKKFNEEMRLQRQESLNQYMEMINRGAH